MGYQTTCLNLSTSVNEDIHLVGKANAFSSDELLFQNITDMLHHKITILVNTLSQPGGSAEIIMRHAVGLNIIDDKSYLT